MDTASELLEDRFRYALHPHMQFIVSRRDVAKMECAVAICDHIEGCGETKDDSAHLRMNVTEDVRYTLAGEYYFFGGTSFVKAEVESLAIEERKDIMKGKIGVWELHHATDRNNQ
jgi:hypothetical protein